MDARMMEILSDNPGVAVLVTGAVLVFVTMSVSWWRIGRDPKPGFIIPRSEPPRGLSPTELSWVYVRGPKSNDGSKNIITALVSLGLRRKLIIEEVGGTIVLKRLKMGKVQSDEDLPAGERALMRSLLGSQDEFAFKRFHRRVIRRADGAFNNEVSAKLSGRYFASNWPLIIVGFSIGALSLLIFRLMFPMEDEPLILIYSFFIMGLTIGWPLAGLYASLTSHHSISAWIMVAGYLMFISFFLPIIYFSFLYVGSENFPNVSALYVAMGSVFIMGATLTVFATLMSRPTPEGRLVLDEIEGFRLFLSVGAGDQMKMVRMPAVTTELFESYLPYAVALGVERQWSKAFEKRLDETEPEKRSSYRPIFYSSPSCEPGNIVQSVEKIVAAIDLAHMRATRHR